MGFTKALFYPTIEIKNEDWLKTAVLFWDEIHTIVPESIKYPYQERTSQYLNDEGILLPFNVSSNNLLVEELSSDVTNYLNTNEGFQLLTQNNNPLATLHRDKLPRDVVRLFEMHPEKFSEEVRYMLRNKLTDEGWLRLDSSFAMYYMTLLANKICEENSLALLTDNELTSNLTDKVRLNNQIKIGQNPYDYYQSQRSRPINLGEGLLTNLIIEKIEIKPSSTLEDVINFKKRYQDELGLFRTNISKLTQNVSSDKPINTIKEEINNIYVNEFLPSYNNLQKALSGDGIKWIAENIMKVAFFSMPTTTIPLSLLGASIPHALLAGAGISLIASSVAYNQNKQSKLRENPYSYLLALNRSI